MGSPQAYEVFVPKPDPLRPVRHVRSTLMVSSIGAVRRAGHFDRYVAYVDPEYKARLLDAVAFAWLPIAVARAHYAACDRLGLTSAEQAAIGRMTGNSIREHLTSAAARVARGVGVTPWTLFEQFPRFWNRAFDGGGVAIDKLGPKEAQVTYVECPLLASRYFRTALTGVALGLVESVCTKAYMSERRGSNSGVETSYRLQWA